MSNSKSYESTEPGARSDTQPIQPPEQAIERDPASVAEAEATGAVQRAALEERVRAQQERDDHEILRIRQEEFGLGAEPGLAPRTEGLVRARDGETTRPMEQSGERRPWQARVDEIRRRSAENLQRLLGEPAESKRGLLQGLSKEEREAIFREAERIEDALRVSIKIPFEALPKIFRDGRIRSRHELQDELKDTRGPLKRLWEFLMMGKWMDYMKLRMRTESKLGIAAQGTPEDPHPIYGALSSGSNQDEKYGGSISYGETTLFLKSDRAKDRTSFSYQDSFLAQGMEDLVTWEHVPVLKAVRDTRTGENPLLYIEAQVHGGVTLEDVEEVRILVDPFSRERVLREITPLVQKYPTIRFALVDDRGDTFSTEPHTFTIEEIHPSPGYAAAS